jgi:hypothetical protein
MYLWGTGASISTNAQWTAQPHGHILLPCDQEALVDLQREDCGGKSWHGKAYRYCGSTSISEIMEPCNRAERK